MAEAFINLTEGSGKKAHAWDRTIGANTVLDEFTLPGEYPLATYNVNPGATISTATADSHLLQIMAGSSLNVRIRYISIEQYNNATTAQGMQIAVFRLTTAGTGGTAVTPAKMDTGDGASGATAMTLPSSKGTESTEWRRGVLMMRQAVGSTTTVPDDTWEWVQKPNGKPLIIAAGTSNGIAFKNLVAVAAGTVVINVEFVETSF